MAQVHLEIQSFNAGELSPLLGARFNVEKVQSGCRRLRNFLIHVHGPAFRRPGMEYMGPAAGNGSKSRLLPFNFSTTTGAVLEFHPSGLRVWSNGLMVPLRTAVLLPYTEQECAELQLIQVNDVCYIAHPAHSPRKLVRFADDDWRISEIAWKWPAMGDANVRSDEIAAPASTELLSVETQLWPEFFPPKQSAVTFGIVNGDTTSATKTVKLQRLIDGAWTTEKTLTWTTVVPGAWGDTWGIAYPVRMTYTGPITATSYADFSWGSTYGNGDGQLPLDILQPTLARTVEVPAGDWQATIHSGPAVPPHAAVTIEKKVGTHWETLHNFGLRPNAANVWRGPKLTDPLTVRFNWDGRAMADGTATVDHLVFPVSADLTLQVSDVSGSARTMTASAPLFLPGHVGSYWEITHRREKPWVTIVGTVGTLDPDTSDPLRVSGKWQLTTYGTWSGNLFVEKSVNGVWVTLRSWSSAQDRNIIADGEEDNTVELRLRIGGGTSVAATGAATPRFVLEALDAEVTGLVKVTAIGSLGAAGKATTATVDIVSPLYANTATAEWTEGAWSDAKGHPRCIALHGGRLWFGGTGSEPMRLWGSVVNDFENFRRSSLDDAGVSFTPAAQSANAMQWMLSHERELIIGTAGDEWTLGTDQGPITPTNVLMQRRSSYGSNPQPAAIVGESVIFLQRGGRKLRQIVPRSDAVAWSASDLTVLAEHVTQQGLSQFAVSTNPFSILWAVAGDGKLLGMTYEVEQNVFGWHIHETAGLIESVAVIRGANVDEIWLIVNRDGVRSVERMDSLVLERRFDQREKLIYLDAAVRVEAPEAFSTVTGLDHLEGQTVSIMAGGGEADPQRVIGGTITLENPVTTVVVGLPFTSELQPMRLEIPLRDGTAQGRRFKTARVVLLLHESLGGEVASAADRRFESLNNRAVGDAMDTVPPLLNGEIETALESRTGDGIDVIVRQSQPLPFNLGAIIVSADVFGS